MRKCKNVLTSYLQYTEQTEAPISYHMWSMLSVIATCLRRKVWFNMGDFDYFPNMYVVLVGPPGRAKKSTAINQAMRLITNFDLRVSADSITREALIRDIKQAEQITQIGVSNLKTHASLTIVSKELSVFLGTGNHDLLALLTDLYDAPEKWEYKTKGSGVDTINGIWLNLLGASTPDWLVGSIPITAIGGGFTSRVIFVVEQDTKCKIPRPKVSTALKSLKEDIKHDLEEISLLSGEYTMTQEAGEMFDAWYMKGNDYSKIDKKFWGYMERKPAHLIKVSMLVAASSSNDMVITKDHVTVALSLLDGIEPRMIEAFGAAGRSEIAVDISDLEDMIKTVGRISRVDILNGVWRDITPTNFDAGIDVLIQMGRISTDVSCGKIFYKWEGRP